MTNLQALLREHKLAYTFIFFKKILSDVVWEFSIQSIRLIPISEDMPNADPVKHRTPNLHQVDGTVWGHWWIETQTYFTRRVFPKKSNWKLNTGRKEKYTFYLNRKGKSFKLVESWFIQKSENTFAPQKNRDHFLICLNKPKCTVWTKQSFFQSRVLFLASGFHEKNCRKMYFVKDHSICQGLVGWKILVHVHPPQFRGK